MELRERVVNAVVSGASRREAADWFDHAAISDADRDKVARTNAQKLFGL